jgi:hypothetical protein
VRRLCYIERMKFKENLKATVVTPSGAAHLVLTIIIILAVAFMGEGSTLLRILVIAASLVVYFITNVDFQAKRKNVGRFHRDREETRRR